MNGWQIQNIWRIAAMRRIGGMGVALSALLFAACSSTTGVTGTPTPPAIVRGQWTRPAFAGQPMATVSSVAFADGDQRVGYDCASTLQAATVTPTPPADLTPSPSPTVNLPGRPTPPSTQNVINALWRTQDGGLTWNAATLPAADTDLLCPISSVIAPDLGNPADIFLLAGHGALNLAAPTSILPGQLRFRLWRSLDGGQTWTELALPTVPNPIQPAILAPYHVIIQIHGARLIFATNYSGANNLFTSDDNGQTWQPRGTDALSGDTQFTDLHAFAGFAAGPNGSLLALATSPTLAASPTPFEIWQSLDGAETWRLLGAPALNLKAGSATHAQLFTAPGGAVAYLLAHALAPDGATQIAVERSTDAGAQWSALGWPTDAANNGAALGGADSAQLGVNFAVDAQGTAFAAPTTNDLPATQDPHGQESAGFFAVGATQTSWTKVATPIAPASTALGLAVSLVQIAEPGATATAPTETPTATSTVEASGTPVATPTLQPFTNGLPTLWTNFGPLAQFTANPDQAGFFGNVLP